MSLTRRDILARSITLGCSAAASPLLAPMSFAAVPSDNRLVVLILRGGTDGLDLLRPVGDPGFAALRPGLLRADEKPGIDLDGFYRLHPVLSELKGMWSSGELGFVQAVSTPYRDKRSHFDGQDLLEAGTGFDLPPQAVREGWLNRLLQVLPGTTGETAFALGLDQMKVLYGTDPVNVWTPETEITLDRSARRLLRKVAAADPDFAAAFDIAFKLTERGLGERMKDQAKAILGREKEGEALKLSLSENGHVLNARFAAERLRADARIASFSIGGWDTHRRQGEDIRKPLLQLAETLLTLKEELGRRVWNRTAVLAMTEFGRAARENGVGGTDHGTGGAMVLAGGALRGGRVYGDWPGLDEADLYDRRDLMPTADVRDYAAAAMQGLFGLDRDVLEGTIFPGLDLDDRAARIIP